MEFTSVYREVAQSCLPLGSTLEEWHEAVGKHLKLVPDSQVYRPVLVRVALSANAPPTKIALTPWMDGWYAAAQKGVAEMLGIPDSRNLELVDDFEENISTWDIDRLASYRDAFRALYKDNVVHALNPPRKIATALYPGKDCLLDQWWADTSPKIATAVAQVLTGTKGEMELTKLCEFEGPVEMKIRDVLSASINQQFIDAHAYTADAKAVSPEQLVKDLSGVLLTSVRMSIRANREIISECMASHIGDSIFGSKGKAVVDDEFSQYKLVANHALSVPAGNNLVVIITDGKNNRRSRKGRRRRKKGVTVHNVTKTTRYDPFLHHHPYRDHPSWWYGTEMYPGHGHHHHYYKKGASVVTRGTTVVTPSAYRGDHKQTVKLYHSFSGRAPAPTREFLQKAGLTREEAVLYVRRPEEKREESEESEESEVEEAEELAGVSKKMASIPVVARKRTAGKKDTGRQYTDAQDEAYMKEISDEVPSLVARNRTTKAATRTIPRKKPTAVRSSPSRAPRMTYDDDSAVEVSRKPKADTRTTPKKVGSERSARPGTRLVRRTPPAEKLRSTPAPKKRAPKQVNSQVNLQKAEENERNQPLFNQSQSATHKSFSQLLEEKRRAAASSKVRTRKR